MSARPPIPPGLEAEAAHLWQFLDQLAESDPTAYKAFIEQKMQESKASKSSSSSSPPSTSSSSPPLFLPTPTFVLYTQQLQPKQMPVFLNVCQSTQVQPILLRNNRQPASADDLRTLSHLLIPLSVGRQRLETTDASEPLPSPLPSTPTSFEYSSLRALASAAPSPDLPPAPSLSPSSPAHVYDVVFHPSTLVAASRSLPLLLALVQLCQSHIAQDHPGVRLHTQVQPLPLLYRGRPQAQQAAGKPKQPPPPQPSIVLPQRGEAQDGEGLKELRLKAEGMKEEKAAGRASKPLIEEVSAKAVPRYAETVDGDRVVVDVWLPGVVAMEELTLEMDGRVFALDSAGYALTLRLKAAVQEATIAAKWSAAKHRLRMTAQRAEG